MVIRGEKKSILIVFYQITEEVFHFREHTFLQEKKEIMQKLGSLMTWLPLCGFLVGPM